jgi:hypothetical protein
MRLATDEPIIASHRLESVKLTPEQGANAGDSTQHGHLFAEAVSRPEIAAPNAPTRVHVGSHLRR